MFKNKKIEDFYDLIIGFLIIFIHFYFYSNFLPNENGLIGHDHGRNFPLFLDAYYWRERNGLFSIPWFSPSFCGGVPMFANPSHWYFSIPQFLYYIFGPVGAVKMSILLVGIIGFWGMYVVVRYSLNINSNIALLASTCFLFNGYFAYRMIIGHIEYHPFMFTPILYLILSRPILFNNKIWLFRFLFDSILVGFLYAYMIFAGMSQILIPTALASVSIWIIVGLFYPKKTQFYIYILKNLLATIVALCLSASKLVAAFSFLKYFPRSDYPHPGIAGVFKIIYNLLKMLAIGGSSINTHNVFDNMRGALKRHEFEYSIGVIPFIIIVIAIVYNTDRIKNNIKNILSNTKQIHFYMFILFLVWLIFPISLNYYTPKWSEVLKSIPFIKHVFVLLRWLSIYIPGIIILMALAFHFTDFLQKYRKLFVIVGIIITIAQNVFIEHHFYHNERYNPVAMIKAFKDVKKGIMPDKITQIVIKIDKENPYSLPVDRNDVLIGGQSQYYCYEPIFGYSLEYFPRKTLITGSMELVKNGVYNVKNPACYLYPEENNCEPGDHFRADQKEDVQSFLSFRPFQYNISQDQKKANTLNIISLIIFPSIFLLSFLIVIWSTRKKFFIK